MLLLPLKPTDTVGIDSESISYVEKYFREDSSWLMPQMMSQMMQFLQQIPTVQQQMQSHLPSSTVTSNSSNSSSRRRMHRTTTSFYCWSHVACAHPSAACDSKRPGHQDGPTFNNKMCSSVAFCPSPNNNSST